MEGRQASPAPCKIQSSRNQKAVFAPAGGENNGSQLAKRPSAFPFGKAEGASDTLNFTIPLVSTSDIHAVGAAAADRPPRAAFPACAGRQVKSAENPSTLFLSPLQAREKKLCKKRAPGGGVSPRARGDQGLRALGGAAGFACTEQDTVFAQPKGGFRTRRGRKRRIASAEPHFSAWRVSADWLSALPTRLFADTEF